MGTSESDPNAPAPEGNGDEGKEEKPSEESEKRFSQADLDKAISERLRRERANLKELQEKAKRFDELEAANKSDAERLTAAQKEAEAKAAAAEQKLQKLALQNAIAMACLKAEVADVEVVQSLIGSSTIEFDEDGNPQGVAERVAEIVKARPYLKGSKFQGDADGGRKSDPPNPNDPEALGKLSMDDFMAQRAKWAKT
jgi:hypothetical protein